MDLLYAKTGEIQNALEWNPTDVSVGIHTTNPENIELKREMVGAIRV